MRHWQVTLLRGEATWTLGVEAEDGPDAFRVTGERVGFGYLGGCRILIREVIPPDERIPGEAREAAVT